MIRPSLPYGEKEIRESYDILVKDTEFNLFLTNKRLILLNDAKKMNLEIRLKDIVGSGFWEAENGDPVIALHVMRENKEARQLLMQFPQNAEDDRKDETKYSLSIYPCFVLVRQERRRSIRIAVHGRGRRSGRTAATCTGEV